MTDGETSPDFWFLTPPPPQNRKPPIINPSKLTAAGISWNDRFSTDLFCPNVSRLTEPAVVGLRLDLGTDLLHQLPSTVLVLGPAW